MKGVGKKFSWKFKGKIHNGNQCVADESFARVVLSWVNEIRFLLISMYALYVIPASFLCLVSIARSLT
jgi:hypothetical protein